MQNGAVTDPTDPDEILKGPAALSAEGRLESRLERVEPAHPPPPEEEKIELAERPPRVIEERIENFRAERAARAQRPWALKLVIAIGVLGVAGFGALIAFQPRLELLDTLAAGGERPTLLITSTPDGATIVIGGKTIGQTPWAGENLWAQDTPLVLQLAGYKRWEGKVKGGQPQTLDIRLRR